MIPVIVEPGVDWAAISASVGGSIIGILGIVFAWRTSAHRSRREAERELLGIVTDLVDAVTGVWMDTHSYLVKYHNTAPEVRPMVTGQWLADVTTDTKAFKNAAARLTLRVSFAEHPEIRAALNEVQDAAADIFTAVASDGIVQLPSAIHEFVDALTSKQNDLLDRIRPLLPAPLRDRSRKTSKDADIPPIRDAGRERR